MGTTLTGTTPQDTYDALIKVGDNGIITGSLKTLSDGEGHDTALALSTGAASVTGTLAVSGDVSIADKIIHTGDTNTAIRFPAADTITFETDAAERMRITSTGNVGIGTSAPADALHLASGSMRITNGASFVSANSAIGSIRTFAGSSNQFETAAITFNTENFVNRGEIIFKTAYDSGLVERGRWLANGGLTFNGDTAAANALDDYEEGTWTMGVSFGGASVGVTTSNNTGTYTKIGRQVTVNGYLLLTSKGSSTGDAQLTGLPFTIPNVNQSFATASLWFANVTFANQFQGYGLIGSTTVNLREITILGVDSALTDADFGNNSQIIVSLTYFV